MSDIKQVLVPDVGGDEVEIIELCVAVGDTVEVEDALVSVETDKASMDIPAPFAGTITEIKVAVGDKINEGGMAVQQMGERVVYKWKDENGVTHLTERMPDMAEYEVVKMGELQLTPQEALSQEEIDKLLKKNK